MAAHHSAQGLASLGRHGDSMLVHMSPHEVAGLNYLAKKQGHKLTINPATGLPEAFSLGGLLSSLLPMFAGSFFPGAGFGMDALLAGAATGAGLAAAKGDNILMGGLTGGLGGISGSNLAQGLGGAAGATGAGGYVPTEAAANTIANPQYVSDSMMKTLAGYQAPTALQQSAANTINQAGFANSAMSGAGNIVDKGLNNLSTMGTGTSNLISGQPGAAQGFKNAFIDPTTGTGALTNTGMAMKIGMPIGGAVLGGLEPSDIYGEPIDMSEAKKKQAYDPYATLNLSGSTGLKLYAAGGNVNTNAPSISTGGLQDLYGTSDNSGGPQALSQDGYGIGRLEGLTAAGSQAKAADMFYAQGGPVSFADGGSSDKVKLEDLSTSTDATTPSPVGIAALANSAQMDQGNKAPSDVNLTAPPTATDGSLITQVANNLKVDPNYQPKNPIEAAIIKQLKGTDPMQQTQQGLGSIAPAQTSFPTAATYAPTQAMAPTYFAGMNAPGSHMAKGGYLDGAGDGMSDSIPATIEGKQPARLADGEFVVPADVVSHIGNGSSKAGSKRLYSMLDKVRKARTGHAKQGKEINPNKYMPA
jgi:hypothetical protein